MPDRNEFDQAKLRAALSARNAKTNAKAKKPPGEKAEEAAGRPEELITRIM
ncbi:hypothetical protein [Streptomyces sp. SID5614]|uniref:hypothetical protein n=1 Tax=Streptomyces sp. SID5614 TaxID=2690306 RepID=UPI00136D31F3|nr:hypothetical protein [Streptomyces sp. SID5614]